MNENEAVANKNKEGLNEIIISGTNQEEGSKKEVSPEAYKKAEQTVIDSLDLGVEQIQNLDNFYQNLDSAVRSLPKFQEIKEKLKDCKGDNFSHELFQLLQKKSDPKKDEKKDLPDDGVLVKSIKDSGKLECAGRVLIASNILEESNIDHAVVSCLGHSLIIIEINPNTLAYFDANNDLYFTFPKSALNDYKGLGEVAECEIGDYTPRTNDIFDGVSPAKIKNLLLFPSVQGRGRQYLGNVGAALYGREEFSKSSIEKNEEAAEAIKEIEKQVFGENELVKLYDQKLGKLVESGEDENRLKADSYTKEAFKIFQQYPEEKDFIDFFVPILEGKMVDALPYLKNASQEKKQEYAKKLYNFFKNKET